MPSYATRVPYLDLFGKYRPYLEIFLVNNNPKPNISNKTLALIDSGADYSVIPYSLGKLIKLPPITSSDKIMTGKGVSGSTSLLERRCIIYLFNKRENKLYGINETVYWAHPNIETLKVLEDLRNKYYEMKDYELNQCQPKTKLAQYFQEEQKKILGQYIEIENFFETDVLLGRPFFDNFDFIQFFHRDRAREEKCFFTYVLSKNKKFRVLDLKKLITS